MSETDIQSEYRRWVEYAKVDTDLIEELQRMNEAQIEDAFYRNLTFGTGGLRGVLGAGTNRMNVYTVARASQGLANYLNKRIKSPTIVVGYDSRIKSDVFSKIASCIFAANGIHVYLWPTLMPVSMVSFAVRYLRASAGVMITASHNPSNYNGYKVYREDGCQITNEMAKDILNEIEILDFFSNINSIDFETAFLDKSISYISDEVYTAFLDAIKTHSVRYDDKTDKNIKIIYSPLNGTGLKPITRILQEEGYTDVTVVKEQEQPDGNFPTCPYPNPELKEAMFLSLEYAKKNDSDLVLVTDPDCDRIGVAVKDNQWNYHLLTGNQVGLLLLDYICSQRIKHKTMPEKPIMFKTIVTMDMGEQIAEHYGVKTINTLTGFRFIGEQIGNLERQNELDNYIFGFEESYGYLIGDYVRDKDGVGAAFLICEMFSFYHAKGIHLLQKLNELYEQYGYCMNTLHTYKFEGASGNKKMKSIMETFRKNHIELGNMEVLKTLDYKNGLKDLPKSNVLKFLLTDHCSLVIRPSGTEAKLKVYISVSAKNKGLAESIEKNIVDAVEAIIKL